MPCYARRTVVLRSVDEADFSCTRIVNSAISDACESRREGTCSEVVKSESDFGQFEDIEEPWRR